MSSGDRPCGRNCPKKATYPALVLRDEVSPRGYTRAAPVLLYRL